MGNYFQHLLFGTVFMVVSLNICNTHPVAMSASPVSLYESTDEPLESDHSTTIITNPLKNPIEEKIWATEIENSTTSDTIEQNVETDNDDKTEEEQTLESSPRKKRDHSHCYRGESIYRGPYWAHGHWHSGRWVYQRPHCHWYHDDYDRK